MHMIDIPTTPKPPFKWPRWVTRIAEGVPYIIGWELGRFLFAHFTINFH